jgi:hypothetical protein
MIVIGKTLARVISSQRETGSISLSADRFWVRMISPQFDRADDAMIAPWCVREGGRLWPARLSYQGRSSARGKEAHQRRARAPCVGELLGKSARTRRARRSP